LAIPAVSIVCAVPAKRAGKANRLHQRVGDNSLTDSTVSALDQAECAGVAATMDCATRSAIPAWAE